MRWDKSKNRFVPALSCPFNVHSLLTSSRPFISQSPSGPEGNGLLVCSPYITYWHWWPDFWILTSDVSFLNQLFKISDSCQRARIFIIPNCHAPHRHWSKHLHLPPQYLTPLKKDMKQYKNCHLLRKLTCDPFIHTVASLKINVSFLGKFIAISSGAMHDR